jgi:hypothetical protein
MNSHRLMVLVTIGNPHILDTDSTPEMGSFTKVVFLKLWGFGICEMLLCCVSHESQSLTVLGKLPYFLQSKLSPNSS